MPFWKTHEPVPTMEEVEFRGGSNRDDEEKKSTKTVIGGREDGGVTLKRSCTDIPCCILFAGYLVFWGCLTVFALYKGDPQRLFHPTDTQGRICGVSKGGIYDLTSRPKLLFYDLTKCISIQSLAGECPTPQVCVEECPKKFFAATLDTAVPLGFNGYEYAKKYCADSIRDEVTSAKTYKHHADRGECPSYTLPYSPFIGRCIPSLLLSPLDATLKSDVDEKSKASGEVVPDTGKIMQEKRFVRFMAKMKALSQSILSDLTLTWWILGLIAFGVALTSLLLLFVMHLIATAVAYFTLALFLVALILGDGLAWMHYVNVLNSTDYADNDLLSMDFSPNTWLGIAITVGVLAVIYILLLIFLCSRIRLAIRMIQEAGKALKYMLCALFFPALPFLFELFVIIWFFMVSIYISSIGKSHCQVLSDGVGSKDGVDCDCDDANTTTVNGTCQFVKYIETEVLHFHLMNVFGLFWTLCFLGAIEITTLAGSFGSYYWARKKPDDIPGSPVLASLRRTLMYHTGSLAFGSLILAIIKLIRLIVKMIQYYMKKQNNKCGQCLASCCSCCMSCLESIVQYLTKNAYILIAIHGEGFISSAKLSFNLVVNNPVRAIVVDKLSDFVLLVGKLLICCVATGIATAIFSGKCGGASQELAENIHHKYIWIMVVFAVSWLISDSFFDVFETGVDTMFLCALEDYNLNEAHPENLLMTDSLRALLK